MKKIKFVIALLLVSVLTVTTSSCWLFKPHVYKGDNPELFTVAVNSIFKANGYRSNGEVSYDPDIEIIEVDSYGRTLFYYYEGMNTYSDGLESDENNKKYVFALLIMQRSDNGYVEYYEDLCLEIHLTQDIDSYQEEIKNIDTSTLKELNDWNKPVDEEKCVKKQVVTLNEGSLDISKDTFKKITRNYATILGDLGDDTIYRYDTYNTSDSYGRELYYVWGVSRDKYGEGISPTSTSQYFHFAIIFNPDGSYNEKTCIVEIKDVINFQEEIRALKANNQWNMPYESC